MDTQTQAHTYTSQKRPISRNQVCAGHTSGLKMAMTLHLSNELLSSNSKTFPFTAVFGMAHLVTGPVILEKMLIGLTYSLVLVLLV